MNTVATNTWIAVSGDAGAMAALCEHLPPTAVIVTTRAQLEAQTEACAKSAKNMLVLLDDSGARDDILAVLKLHATRLHLIHLKSPESPALSIAAISIHTIDKPAKIPDLARQIRRQLGQLNAQPEIPVSPSCTLVVSRQILRNPASGVEAEMTEKETQILAFLFSLQPGAASREQLHREVWGYQGELNTHTLETHIYRLRSKIRDIGAEDITIENTAAGYCLSAAK